MVQASQVTQANSDDKVMRKKIPIQLEQGEQYIKSYCTKQTVATALTTAGGGMMSSVTTIGDGDASKIIKIVLVAAMMVLMFQGIRLLRHKAHLTTKRLVFVAPGKGERSLLLSEVKALGTGEGKKKKVLMIDIGDGNPEQNELSVLKHLKVADEIAKQARACGAKLK